MSATETEAIADIATNFAWIGKIITSLRGDGPDFAATYLLFQLTGDSCRVSDLAETSYVDPSVVSRQISSLAERGLVEKVPDEADGRASKVVITDKGRSLVDELRTARAAMFASILDDWEPADQRQFADYLDRFRTDLETYRAGRATTPAN